MPAARSTIIVGLTGGVGSGKTTAERLCKAWGYPTADADLWAHELLAHDAAVQAKVRAYCRKCYTMDPLLPSGELDRAALAQRAFADGRLLTLLERLIHPRVRRRAAAWIAAQRAQRAPLALLVVPLLLESGMNADVDVVLSIAAPEALRCARLRKARGWSEAHVRARMARQLDEDERCRRSDAVVTNTGGKQAFAAALRQTLTRIRLRHGRKH